MQQTRLTIEGTVRDPDVTDGETILMVDDAEQVTLSIAGDAAAVSQGWGWEPYECVYDGTEMPVGSDPCPNCGQNNVRPTPLMWASSAAIVVNSEADMVQLRLNLLTGGFIQLEVHRSQDGNRLIVHTPQEGILQGGAETITKISEGAYEIKE